MIQYLFKVIRTANEWDMSSSGRNVNIANSFQDNMADLKYVVTAMAHQHYIHKKQDY